jgi:hypothetical protein
MRSIFVAIIFLVIATSCNFSKSVKKDFISGILTKGDGLSCDNVYLSLNDEETRQNTFIYGQKFKMNFDNISGFRKENDNVFPGMQITVINSEDDTILQSDDLYSGYPEGLSISPLMLTAAVTAAKPIYSGGEYTLYVKIWDKKEDGTFTGEADFKVVPNEHIIVNANKILFNELYLYSKERGAVIPDNKIKFNENVYVIFEGLAGFTEENGMVFPGLGITASDNENNVVLDNKDMFLDYSESGISAKDVLERVSANFILTGNVFKNPMHFQLRLWDKKSDAGITAKAELLVE